MLLNQIKIFWKRKNGLSMNEITAMPCIKKVFLPFLYAYLYGKSFSQFLVRITLMSLISQHQTPHHLGNEPQLQC